MSTAYGDRLRELFLAAVELPAERQAEFLNEACGDDDELRAKVESLIRRDRTVEEFMDRPSVPAAATEPPSAPVGKRIGRYQVTRVIGAGGMGVVYEAVQDHPHRRVALKVLRRGAAAPRAMKRFQHEAELLGRLQHPNIAQIYEADTFDEGHGAQPYFAMELIEGRPPLAYAEQGQLGTRDRLALFVKVCDAVRYAHGRSVIHRDLKPDNILVDEHGEPKILDFGVARATDVDIQTTTLRTNIGELIGTVPYMSPEQVAGDPRDVDARSDVYSLGVLLYELVAGQLPHDLADKTIPEAVRIIGQDDCTPLSSVDRSFRGDLDTIVAKALEKDKDRRYQTAAELAADVRHFLSDEPIVARPASTFYQVRKFARRNRGLVGGVAAAFAILLVALVAVSLQAVRINREAVRTAESSAFFETLLLKANLVCTEATSISPEEVGLNISLVDILTDAIQRLDEQPLSDRALEATFRYRAGVGLFAASRLFASRDQLERAVQMRRELFGNADPRTAECKVALAMTLHFIAGGDDAAEQLAQEALVAYDAESGPPDEAYMQALFTLAAIQIFGDDPEAGERTARDMVRILEESERSLDFASFVPKTQLAAALCLLDRPDDAVPWIEAAYDEMEAQTRGDHPIASLLYDVHGMLAARQGLWDKAERLFDLAEQADAVYRDPNTILGSEALMVRAIAEEWRGGWAATASLWRRILANTEASLGPYNVNTALGARIVSYTLMRAGKTDEAEEAYRHWSSIADRIDVPASLGPDWTRYWFARVLAANGKAAEAEEQFRRAVEMAIDARGEDHELTLRAGNELAWLLWGQGRYEDAEPIARDAVAGYRRTREAPDLPMLNAVDTLACIRRDLGRADEALELFQEIESAFQNPTTELATPTAELVRHHALRGLGQAGEGGGVAGAAAVTGRHSGPRAASMRGTTSSTTSIPCQSTVPSRPMRNA